MNMHTPPTVGADWPALLAAYRAARAAESAYNAKHCDIYDDLPIGPERTALIQAIPLKVWAESEQLSDIRCHHEDALMVCPSPDASGLAVKLIVARGNERDANGYDALLLAEAKRFADGTPSPPSFGDLEQRLQSAWRAQCEAGSAFDRIEQQCLAYPAGAARNAIEAELGLDPAELAMEATVEATDAACDALLSSPASTPAEVAAKLAWSLCVYGRVEREALSRFVADISKMTA